MTSAAWEELPGYAEFWDPFTERFAFRPSHEGAVAICEPAPSVTVDLAPVFAHEGARFAAGLDAVNALGLLAMTHVFPESQRLVVLDWQHSCWWFRPHRQALDPRPEWPVGVFPNGDYYAFLTEDMSTGTFGHPWEQTLCVFGDPLVTALAPLLTSWLPVKRSR
ncbi:DUF2716 domain-containing protein [Herbidospora cretacea]|uniref:DUF2716 domain-containing protein n=1 Tax=Herbidospora cretacea TaxID=28444 RepID=UPI0004C2D5B1|nr:DUF2716 domain-containing protein [Herbidospora cretacea]